MERPRPGLFHRHTAPKMAIQAQQQPLRKCTSLDCHRSRRTPSNFLQNWLLNPGPIPSALLLHSPHPKNLDSSLAAPHSVRSPLNKLTPKNIYFLFLSDRYSHWSDSPRHYKHWCNDVDWSRAYNSLHKLALHPSICQFFHWSGSCHYHERMTPFPHKQSSIAQLSPL